MELLNILLSKTKLEGELICTIKEFFVLPKDLEVPLSSTYLSVCLQIITCLAEEETKS